MHIKSNPTVQRVNRKIYTLEISYPFPREAAKKVPPLAENVI